MATQLIAKVEQLTTELATLRTEHQRAMEALQATSRAEMVEVANQAVTAANARTEGLRTEVEKALGQVQTAMVELAASAPASLAAAAAPAQTRLPRVKYAVLTYDEKGKLSMPLDTWFQDVEGCFVMDGVVEDTRKILVATRTAMAGHPRQVCLDEEAATQKGQPGANWPTTWEGFKSFMLKTFAQHDRVKAARERLHALSLASCQGDVEAYVAQSKQQHIVAGSALSESEKYHYFMRGLDAPLAEGIVMATSAAEAAGQPIPETFATAASIALKVAFKRPGKVLDGGNNGAPGAQGKVAWADMHDEPSSSGAGESGTDPMHLAAMSRRSGGGGRGNGGGFDRPPRMPYKLRKKLMAENKCLICHEKGHFWQDCPMLD